MSLNRILVFAVSIILFFVALPFPQRTVNAQQKSDPIAELKAQQAADFILACAEMRGYKGDPTSGDLKAGDFINTPRSARTMVAVSFYLSDSGVLNCNDKRDVSKAMDALDTNAENLLTTGDNPLYVLDGNKYKLAAGGDDAASFRRLNSTMTAHLSSLGYGNDVSNAAKYFSFLKTFEETCGKDGTSPTGSEISRVDRTTGEIRKEKYVLRYNDPKDALSAGNALYDAIGGVGTVVDIGINVSCSNLVNFINAFADQASAAVKSGEIDPGSDDAAETEPSCESEQGVMSWVMCPVINLLDGSLNWVDTQIQALLEVDSNYYSNDGIRTAFANIRNLAYIILVPIVLVMVIGTAMGFDFVSAYTVKRALPRLIIAVIFIALSYNISVFLVSFFNELGSAVLGILMAPFSGGAESFSLNDMYAGNVLSGIVTGALGAVGLVLLLWLFGGTLLLFAIIAFLVMMLRQMFIVVLMLAAPLAILAWIFPGNDKLWKLWWGSFSKLLMMYPLIMALIAMGRIFAFTIWESGGAGLEGAVFQPVMTLVAYMLPYAFIPFTFKFAGGMFATVSGMVNDRSKGMFDRQRKRREDKYAKSRRIGMQYRAGANRALMERGSSGGKFRRLAYRGAARAVGGRDLEAKMSAYTAEEGKKVQEQIATGVDSDIRGSTVNMKAAQATEAAKMVTRADGTRGWDDSQLRDALWRVNDEGKREYKTLGGAWVQEADVINGHKRFGRNRFAQQAALSYEMRKAMTEDDVTGLQDRYADLARDQWGMSETEARGAWIGSAFENQNQNLIYKYTDPLERNDDGSVKMKSQGLIEEVYQKRGSYQMSQMGADTIKALEQAYVEAERTGDDATMQKARAVAETFMARYGGGEGMMQEDAEGNMVPMTSPTVGQPGAATRESYRTSAPGAGRVAEVAREFAVRTGVYGPRDPSTNTESTHGPYPDPRQD